MSVAKRSSSSADKTCITSNPAPAALDSPNRLHPRAKGVVKLVARHHTLPHTRLLQRLVLVGRHPDPLQLVFPAVLRQFAQYTDDECHEPRLSGDKWQFSICFCSNSSSGSGSNTTVLSSHWIRVKSWGHRRYQVTGMYVLKDATMLHSQS
eukprot:136874-Rhodomonas_salina.3